jgi:hypothetical protein
MFCNWLSVRGIGKIEAEASDADSEKGTFRHLNYRSCLCGKNCFDEAFSSAGKIHLYA